MISTADLVDHHGETISTCAVQFRSFGARTKFAGDIVTIRSRDDNVLLREKLHEPGVGRVLVVDGGGSLQCALVGDAIAEMAAAQGWEGLILHGAVRDVAALRHIDIGVLALGASPRRSGKQRTGVQDVNLVLGGATFRPNDFVVADEDGVITSPARLPVD